MCTKHISERPQDRFARTFFLFYQPAVFLLAEIPKQSAWKVAIEDTEDKLVSWVYRDIKRNMDYELHHLHNK